MAENGKPIVPKGLDGSDPKDKAPKQSFGGGMNDLSHSLSGTSANQKGA